MADTNQQEATTFFRALGFSTIKNVDLHFQSAGVVSANGKAVYPTKGLPDMCFFGNGPYGGVCEVKSGRGKSGEYFYYSQIDADKRKWIADNQSNLIQYWLFIGMGNTILDKKYPRITLFMPLSAFTELEMNATKKALPLREALLSPFRLDWKKNGLWGLPQNHLFRTIYPVKELV